MSTSISVTQYQQSLKFRLLSNLVFECPKTFREEGEVVNWWRTNGEINDSRYMAHLLQGKLSIHDMIRIDMIHVLSWKSNYGQFEEWIGFSNSQWTAMAPIHMIQTFSPYFLTTLLQVARHIMPRNNLARYIVSVRKASGRWKLAVFLLNGFSSFFVLLHFRAASLKRVSIFSFIVIYYLRLHLAIVKLQLLHYIPLKLAFLLLIVQPSGKEWI